MISPLRLIFAAALSLVIGTMCFAQDTAPPLERLEQCLDVAICPIPYVRLSKQETEPYLKGGKIVDTESPLYDRNKAALKRYPDVLSCLKSDEISKLAPDLRRVNWNSIRSDKDAEVCVFRMISSIQNPEVTKQWLAEMGFRVSRIRKRPAGVFGLRHIEGEVLNLSAGWSFKENGSLYYDGIWEYISRNYISNGTGITVTMDLVGNPLIVGISSNYK